MVRNTVTAAHMIRNYSAPQYLVELVPGGECGDDDVSSINEEAGFDVLTDEVQGWGEYNAIIRLQSVQPGACYLATVETVNR